MAAILIFQNPEITETQGQPTRKTEVYHYGAADGDPAALGTVDGSYRMTGRTSKPAPNGDGKYWTLTWTTGFNGGAGNPAETKADDTPVYTADDAGVELPLARNPNYLTCWDHDLCARYADGDAVPTLPDWWDERTDTVIPSTIYGDSEDFFWSRSDFPNVAYDPDGRKWITIRLAARTKPGVDSFKAPALTVTETRYFTSETAGGLDVASAVGTLAAPGELYGGPAGADAWLIVSARVYPDGARWASQKIYQTAGKIAGVWVDWDTDLYEGVAL